MRTGFLQSVFFGTMLMALVSCSDCVSGSGEIHQEERLMPTFSALSSQVAANVTIKPRGDRPAAGIVINAQPQIMPLITASVVEGVLRIASAQCYNSTLPVEIIVYTDSLHAIDFSGSGNIRSELVLGPSVVDIIHSGSGNLEFLMDGTWVRTELLGSGDIRSSGRADQASINLSGSGNVYFGELVVNKTQAELNGSGNIECQVNEYADFSLNGSGNILYSGTAKNITTQNNGSGEIRHIQ
jgi:hypothetical protein